jgi:hypothetical protein
VLPTTVPDGPGNHLSVTVKLLANRVRSWLGRSDGVGNGNPSNRGVNNTYDTIVTLVIVTVLSLIYTVPSVLDTTMHITPRTVGPGMSTGHAVPAYALNGVCGP